MNLRSFVKSFVNPTSQTQAQASQQTHQQVAVQTQDALCMDLTEHTYALQHIKYFINAPKDRHCVDSERVGMQYLKLAIDSIKPELKDFLAKFKVDREKIDTLLADLLKHKDRTDLYDAIVQQFAEVPESVFLVQKDLWSFPEQHN